MKKIVYLIILALILGLVLAGCLPSKNQSPIITSTPSTLAEVGELYTYDVEATDPDGDTLTYSLDVKPSGMTINPTTGLISWTPTAEGDYDVVVKVSDGALEITQSFTIVVSEAEGPGYTPNPEYTPTPSINHAPTITSIPITTVTVDDLYVYDVDATDPDGDTLTYSLTTSPAGMTINSTTGVIGWTPNVNQIGEQDVEGRVSDGTSFDTQTFKIIVEDKGYAVNVTDSSGKTSVVVGNKQINVNVKDEHGVPVPSITVKAYALDEDVLIFAGSEIIFLVSRY